MLPVIEMLEKDNQVLMPQLGLPHSREHGLNGLTQLSQLDGDDIEYVMLKDDEDGEDQDNENDQENNQDFSFNNL